MNAGAVVKDFRIGCAFDRDYDPIHHVDCSVYSDCDVCRIDESKLSGGCPLNFKLEKTIWVELLNSEVVGVCDINSAFSIESHKHGFSDLTVLLTLSAKLLNKFNLSMCTCVKMKKQDENPDQKGTEFCQRFTSACIGLLT